MAATAFLAASSRSSADVIGRPLSDRILFASSTFVPADTGEKTHTVTTGNGAVVTTVQAGDI